MEFATGMTHPSSAMLPRTDAARDTLKGFTHAELLCRIASRVMVPKEYDKFFLLLRCCSHVKTIAIHSEFYDKGNQNAWNVLSLTKQDDIQIHYKGTHKYGLIQIWTQLWQINQWFHCNWLTKRTQFILRIDAIQLPNTLNQRRIKKES